MAEQDMLGSDWLAEIRQNISELYDASLTILATDAQAKAGVSTEVALTPANLVAALAALDFPIVMSKSGGFSLGTLSSANDTSGVALSSAKTAAVRVNADTGGVALTGGFIRAQVARMLIGTAITSGADISTAGLEGLLKMIVSVNVGGNQAGIMGHLESAGTLTLTGTINVVRAAVAAFLDLDTGATIAAGTVVSAFGVNPAKFGSVSGRTAVIHVTNPFSGTWDSLFDLSGDQGLDAEAAGAVNDKFGVIYVDGVKYTFPLSRAA